MFEALLHSPRPWMAPLWVIVLGVVLWRWLIGQPRDIRYYFGAAVLIKLLALAILVYFYSQSTVGDLVYFWQVKVPTYFELLDTHPELTHELWGYLLWNDAATDAALQEQFGGQLYQYFNYPEAFEMHFLRLVALLYLLTGGNFIAGVLLGTSIGLLGQWWVWRGVCAAVDRCDTTGFLCVFGVPSVAIFTASFMKETVLVFGLGLLMLALLNQTIRIVPRMMYGTLGWLLMLSIKPYLASSLAPFVLLVLVWQFTKDLSSQRKKLLRLGVLVVGMAGVVLFWDSITYMLGYGRYLRTLTLEIGAGSGNYVDIGQYELTAPGILKAGILGALVTLFGPLPQHINNVWGWGMLLENILWLSGCVYLLFHRLRAHYRLHWQPVLWLMLVWPVCYCAILGMSVPYYGSLLRYRTLALILLVSGVYLLYATATASARRT
mgnify:CR=1 FL=1